MSRHQEYGSYDDQWIPSAEELAPCCQVCSGALTATLLSEKEVGGHGETLMCEVESCRNVHGWTPVYVANRIDLLLFPGHAEWEAKQVGWLDENIEFRTLNQIQTGLCAVCKENVPIVKLEMGDAHQNPHTGFYYCEAHCGDDPVEIDK